jgi:predicted HTH domain antitoxin
VSAGRGGSIGCRALRLSDPNEHLLRRTSSPYYEIVGSTVAKGITHDKLTGGETLDVKLRSELLRAANLEQSTLSEEAAQLLALEVELYREGKVSLRSAAELCQTPIAAFMDFAAKHGVPPPRYSFEDLEETLDC